MRELKWTSTQKEITKSPSPLNCDWSNIPKVWVSEPFEHKYWIKAKKNPRMKEFRKFSERSCVKRNRRLYNY